MVYGSTGLLTVNSDFLIWLMLQSMTEGKYTSDREAVVVAMVVTTVLLVKSWMEACRKMVATAREANTIINHKTFPPDSTCLQTFTEHLLFPQLDSFYDNIYE